MDGIRRAIAEDAAVTGPAFVFLGLLMVFDVIGGLLVAFAKGTLSSTVSREGMVRKTLTLMTVAACMMLDGVLPIMRPEVKVGLVEVSAPITLGLIVAAFFCVTEFLSFLEKVARVRGKVPRFLRRYLVKVRDALEDIGSEETAKE